MTLNFWKLRLWVTVYGITSLIHVINNTSCYGTNNHNKVNNYTQNTTVLTKNHDTVSSSGHMEDCNHQHDNQSDFWFRIRNLSTDSWVMYVSISSERLEHISSPVNNTYITTYKQKNIQLKRLEIIAGKFSERRHTIKWHKMQQPTDQLQTEVL